MIITSEHSESDALLNIAKLMVVAARTAPKAQGEDNIKAAIITGIEKDELATVMEQMGKIRDSKNVRDSEAVVLLGVDFGDPIEDWINFKAKLIDLGIALGSAVKVASELNVDNRIMHSIGIAANKMELLKADEIKGIPLSIKGKSIFFDRKN
ncbi:MAG TPA: DUF2148 domain-containing protein [Candidatus Bathyarchaeia archaeon]